MMQLWENTGRKKRNRESVIHAPSSPFPVLCKPSGMKQVGSITSDFRTGAATLSVGVPPGKRSNIRL